MLTKDQIQTVDLYLVKDLSHEVATIRGVLHVEKIDLLVIDNEKTIHGRKPFQPRYNGTDRWVQRVLVRKEIPPSNQINGHVITTKFGG